MNTGSTYKEIESGIGIRTISGGIAIRSHQEDATLRGRWTGEVFIADLQQGDEELAAYVLQPGEADLEVHYRHGDAVGHVREPYESVGETMSSRVPPLELKSLVDFLDRYGESDDLKKTVRTLASENRQGERALAPNFPPYGQYCRWACQCCSRSHGVLIYCCISCVTCDWIDMP